MSYVMDFVNAVDVASFRRQDKRCDNLDRCIRHGDQSERRKGKGTRDSREQPFVRTIFESEH